MSSRFLNVTSPLKKTAPLLGLISSARSKCGFLTEHNANGIKLAFFKRHRCFFSKYSAADRHLDNRQSTFYFVSNKAIFFPLHRRFSLDSAIRDTQQLARLPDK